MSTYLNPFRALKEFGVKGTFWKMWHMRTLKFGRLVGVDKYGNKYYENKEDYPSGQHRWIEYANSPAWYDVDASAVPAKWHAWLHYTVEDPPEEDNIASEHQKVPDAVLTNSDAPYKTNVGGVLGDHEPNPSLMRPRGYGLDNGMGQYSPLKTQPNEHRFYMQPGFAMDPRNEHPRPARRMHSLKDTPETIAKRKLEQMEKFQGAKSAEARSAMAAHSSKSADTGMSPHGVVEALELNEDEQALVEETAGSWSIDDLELESERLQHVIQEYKDMDMPAETTEGIEQAEQLLASVQRKLRVIRGIEHKYRAAGGLGSLADGLP